MEERRSEGFARLYYRVVGWAIDHRWMVLARRRCCSFAARRFAPARSKHAFFPKDLSYLSYVDVWLPEDAPLSATSDDGAQQAEQVIREVGRRVRQGASREDGKPRDVLQSVTTFVGGGGPRFWFSVSPELQQLNYAQLIVKVNDKHDTPHLVRAAAARARRRESRRARRRAPARERQAGRRSRWPIRIVGRGHRHELRRHRRAR